MPLDDPVAAALARAARDSRWDGSQAVPDMGADELLDAAPVPDPTIEKARAPRLIQGELPSHSAPPTGCVFNTRCPIAVDECRERVPDWRELLPGHWVFCHRA